jgi:exodeoxyribonuclease VIII
VLRADIVEQPITWIDEEHGIACKGIPDVVGDGTLVDVKTAQSVIPGIFCAAAAKFGYHAQLAFYRDGLVANGHRITDVAIVAAESQPPYDVAVFRLGEHTLACGRDLYRELLGEYAECVATNEWPGVARNQLLDLKLPAWAGGESVGDDLDWSGLSEQVG